MQVALTLSTSCLLVGGSKMLLKKSRGIKRSIEGLEKQS